MIQNSVENVFLFVPNIIGYARIILALISFYYMPTDYVIASWCYILSALLDAFDGHAARYFNQSTQFGAILDQLTDRCSTMCLLATLCTFYPGCIFWFQLLMVIDIAGHWIHLHSCVLQGRTSHKFINPADNKIMKMYYTNKKVLFFMCATNELFFASLYLCYFTNGPFGIFVILTYLMFPFMIVKTLISLIHAYFACKNLAIMDIRDRALKRTHK